MKHRIGLRLVVVAFLAAFQPIGAKALSLPDGDLISSEPGCSGVLSSFEDICKLVDFAGFGCKPTVNLCAKGTQELFSGALIEFATPQNMKVWNGLGGLGGLYNSAAFCMMRDLKNMPGQRITTHAKTDAIEAASRQTVGFTGFDPKGAVTAYHRLQACGPVVGCMDVLTQKIKLVPVSNPVTGLKAGQYDIKESYAVQVTSDGIAQYFTTAFPRIEVPTPIGPVTVQPEFRVGRASGLLSAPFDGNQQTNYPSLYLPTQSNRTFDVHGRNPGAQISTISPIDTALNDPEWKFSQKGWISTIATGGRDAGTANAVWVPSAQEPYPIRPDLDPKAPRSKKEKIPNAYLGASANVEYSILDKLPTALRNRLSCSGFVSICPEQVSVFAKPSVDLVFSSQLSFFQNEQSYWNGSNDGHEFPMPILTPNTFDQAKELRIMASSAVAAMTSLETGLNLAIHLKVKGPFGFSKYLVNMHPRTVIPLASESAFSMDTKTSTARSLGSAVVAQGRFFQDYTNWSGKNLAASGKDGGSAAIQECLKAPLIEEVAPPTPKYVPGNPNDWFDLMEQPCNICVAWDDIKYQDEKGVDQVEPKGVFTVFPASKQGFKDTDQWVCAQGAQLGCYDTCKVAADGTLTVKHTAIQLIASGQGTDMPKSCRIYDPTHGN